MQRRIESAVEDAESLAGTAADEARNGVAVHRVPRERAKHEHV
jgi:hypothetical protein